jgi:hypothetical protein
MQKHHFSYHYEATLSKHTVTRYALRQSGDQFYGLARIRGTKSQEMEVITATLYTFIQLEEDSKCKGANRL